MNRRPYRFFMAVVGLFAVSLVAVTIAGAQERRGGPPGHGPRGQRPHGRPGEHGPGGPFPQGLSLLSSEMRLSEKVVKGVPFSAQVAIESNQTLANGTRLTRKTTGLIYRDGEGRTRRDQTIEIVGPFAPAGEPPQRVFINDPVAGTHYVLDPQNRTARKLTLSEGPPPPPPPDSSDVKTESLGKQTIEGVLAEGTRATITVVAGLVGNDRPFDIVSERWDGVELQTIVLSKHSDPRMGEFVYRLTNITRSEPARSMFEIPADYKIEEGRFPPGPPRRGMKKHRFD